MDRPNPYAAPKSEVADSADTGDSPERLARIASGQRFIIFALVAQVLAYILVKPLGALGLVATLVALAVSVAGVVVLSSALGRSILSRVLLALGMFIPLVSLLVLASLSGQATRRLRAGGYRVGLLGARRPAVG